MIPLVVGGVLGSVLVALVLIVTCICCCCYIKNKTDHFDLSQGTDISYFINSVLFSDTNSKNIKLSKKS